jgi:hypothetical protein
MNSKLFGKLKAGEQRLFRKVDDGAHKMMGKMKSQVFDNPRFIHTASNALNAVSNYGRKLGPVASGLAVGLGQPELLPAIGAATALAGAAGHASHLLNDRANYLEKKVPKQPGNNGPSFQ